MSRKWCLPFFPTPLEGECFFSILSRYHEMSCHFTNHATSMEMFGRVLDLGPTLILPVQLVRLDSWVPRESGLNSMQMMREHTAWPYLQMSSRYGKNPFTPIAAAIPSRGRRMQSRMIRDTQHPGFMLRYCPLCAQKEIQIARFPFWHVLPQLKGAILCPVHGIPYAAIVSERKHLRTYVTAASILDESTLAATMNKSSTEFHSDTANWLIRLSSVIDWMLHHGSEFKSPDILNNAYKTALADKKLDWPDVNYLLDRSREKLQLILDREGEMQEYEELVRNRRIDLLSPLHHAILVNLLFDTPNELLYYTT